MPRVRRLDRLSETKHRYALSAIASSATAEMLQGLLPDIEKMIYVDDTRIGAVYVTIAGLDPGVVVGCWY